MLPHPRGEADSVATAFFEIQLALDEFDETGLDDNSREWVGRLKDFMDISGLSDPSSEGLFTVKARTFNTDDKLEISHLVDELAHWFSSLP